MGNVQSDNEQEENINRAIKEDYLRGRSNVRNHTNQRSRARSKNKSKSKKKMSLIDFDNDYNAYEILGVENNCRDKDRIKKNYYKLALKYHPDKNNGEILDQFIIIKEAYQYLRKRVKNQNFFEEKITQDVVKEEYKEQEFVNEKRQNVHLNSKNFNIEKFNQVFSENKVFNPYEKGYGDLKEDEDELIRGVPINGFSINNFNDNFNNAKKQVKHNSVIEYKGPEANYQCNMGYNELGVDEINDFGVENKFTDYRKAYGSQSVLLDESSIQQRKDYRNLNDYKRDRENVNISDEDKNQLSLREKHEKMLELERQEKVKKYDKMIENNFNRLNQFLIIN